MRGMAETAHPLARSVFRGLAHRCPACGTGRLFGRYLKVQPTCEECAHKLSQYRADDGPAYLTIVVIGHVVIAPLLFFPIIWESPAQYSLPILLTALVAITLAVLPRIKGGWVGMMYALGVSDRDDALHTGDLAD
jgi:uncharacterized protein (DUF983 family)